MLDAVLKHGSLQHASCCLSVIVAPEYITCVGVALTFYIPASYTKKTGRQDKTGRKVSECPAKENPEEMLPKNVYLHFRKLLFK
jgi:hypothetical protein